MNFKTLCHQVSFGFFLNSAISYSHTMVKSELAIDRRSSVFPGINDECTTYFLVGYLTRSKFSPSVKRACFYSSCTIWMLLPTVSLKTANLTVPITVGSTLNSTPSPFNLSYSLSTSATSNWVQGMPASIRAS